MTLPQRHRYTMARRAVQLGVLVLFIGTLHGGWTLLGAPLLAGNLSASTFAGIVPMADPLAVLQLLAARQPVASTLLLGAAVTLAVYALAGGRVFCAWVCPMNIVTDAAESLRQRIGGDGRRDLLRLSRSTRYAALALTLAVSAAAGVAAFEWLSPVAMLHRELIYGAGLGLSGALALFLFDTFVLRHGWCGHLCPLGAFWALVGRATAACRLPQPRVGFDAASCTRCGECIKACPEPPVLNLPQAAERGLVASAECTNCARCIAVCPESSLRFVLRASARPGAPRTTSLAGGSS